MEYLDVMLCNKYINIYTIEIFNSIHYIYIPKRS